MKKSIASLLTILMLLTLFTGIAEEANQEPECEWNVLFYLCGTDLESNYGAASLNLAGIAEATANESVNMLIQTGGTKEWHTLDNIGVEVANDRLQRWAYGKDGFTLVEEAEDACMSHADTLSDFIKWAGENYPAKKNMLLLWDHGGGSLDGMIVDENYDRTIMPVYALERALRDGGVHFDLILTDMCLMASLEVCQAMAPYADYLAASEEVMAGDGTCYGKWVSYLYERPECSAVQLAKRVCDLTQQSYAEKDDKNTMGMFTMSVIDLSKTDALAAAFNAFITEVAGLTQNPEALYKYARATYYTENYMAREMYDLFDLAQRAIKGGISPKAAHAVQDAVEDAVVYNLRSSSHMYSHGLSVFNALNMDALTLDHFARTSKNAEHLAYLDCINPKWDAPDWVYEKTERLPELDRVHYLIKPTVSYSEDGSTAWLTMETGDAASVFLAYELMQKDAKSGVLYSLGTSGELEVEMDEETGAVMYAAGFDGTWPTLGGLPQYMEIADDTEEYVLYNIPVIYSDQVMQMRVKKDYPFMDEQGEAMQTQYEIQGIWNQLDSHTGLPGRDVYPMSEIEGEKVSLCRVLYSSKLNKIADHLPTKEMTLAKSMRIAPEKLPVGDYLMRFVVKDVFGNVHYTKDMFPVKWDGKRVTYPEAGKPQ